jgi:tetratricopeptide (TPR) repeat protein
MIERDYVMRMIRQLSAAIAKVLFRIEQKQLPEAFREIDDASQALIGAPVDFLRTLSDEQLLSLLGSHGQTDKLMAAAELLKQLSRVHALQGETDESIRQGAKAFSLYAELLLRHKDQAKLLSGADWARLLEDLERFEFPPAVELKRSRYYELKGDRGKAMEVLGALIQRNPEFRTEGAAMASRLEALSDAELTQHGLSRASILRWRGGWENATAS